MGYQLSTPKTSLSDLPDCALQYLFSFCSPCSLFTLSCTNKFIANLLNSVVWERCVRSNVPGCVFQSFSSKGVPFKNQYKAFISQQKYFLDTPNFPLILCDDVPTFELKSLREFCWKSKHSPSRTAAWLVLSELDGRKEEKISQSEWRRREPILIENFQLLKGKPTKDTATYFTFLSLDRPRLCPGEPNAELIQRISWNAFSCLLGKNYFGGKMELYVPLLIPFFEEFTGDWRNIEFSKFLNQKEIEIIEGKFFHCVHYLETLPYQMISDDCCNKILELCKKRSKHMEKRITLGWSFYPFLNFLKSGVGMIRSVPTDSRIELTNMRIVLGWDFEIFNDYFIACILTEIIETFDFVAESDLFIFINKVNEKMNSEFILKIRNKTLQWMKKDKLNFWFLKDQMR